MAIRAVLFDLDDTLMLDMPSVVAAFEATAAAVAPDLDGALLVEAVRARARELWRGATTGAMCQALGISSWEGLAAEFTGGHPCVEPLREWAPAYRRDAWSHALEDLGVLDEALAEGLAARFQLERGARHVLFDDSIAALDALRSEGFALGIVTNGPPDMQRDKLVAAGILARFDVVVISGVAGVGKPDPEVLTHALGPLGVDAAQAAIVGDNPRRDVAVGRAGGLRTVQIDRHGDWGDAPRADAYVGDLTDIVDVVRAL